MKYLLCMIYLLFSVLGLTFMKIGSNEGAKIFFQISSLKFTLQSIIGYGCYIISFVLYTVIISKFDLSYIYPIIGGITNVIILFIAILFFHEKFTVFSIIGVAFIVIGVLFVNVK